MRSYDNSYANGHGHAYGPWTWSWYRDGSRLASDAIEVEEGLREERAGQVVEQDARVVGRVPRDGGGRDKEGG